MVGPDVSVIVPTHNREVQVYEKCRRLLAEERVGELIVVIDGSVDGTLKRMQSIDDPRLKLILHEKAEGPSRARNAGMRLATYPWIALLDDDDHQSDGFLDALIAVAQESGATVVGTPWLHLGSGMSPGEGFEMAERSQSGPSLISPSIVPQDAWTESLWIPLNIILNHSALGNLRFDEGYRGNYWREETDFFVSVVRSGGKVVVTNRAYSFQYDKPAGGIDRSKRLLYEFWVARNDVRFMARHGLWLKRHRYIDGIAQFLWSSMARRCRPRLKNLFRLRLADKKT